MYGHEAFADYTTTIDGQECYFAGLPGYPRNFSRDTIIAGIIAADHLLLNNQMAMSYLHQGKVFDPLTGEEPGKIHHEYPGVTVQKPFITTYNACDATALYTTGLEVLKSLNKRESTDFLNTHQHSIEAALTYMTAHIKNGIFWEYPPSGADHYSLRITYLKDSILPQTDGREEPTYPVSYGLAQFQVARGILAAANLLGSNELKSLADTMFTKGIDKFITQKAYCIEEDSNGRLEQASSDELHALAYIPKKYHDLLPLDSIRHRVVDLISDAGIASTPDLVSQQLRDTYHGYVVWIFEQAMIHYGATKFGLHDIATITERCIPYIENGRELLTIDPAIEPRGNSHQLWSVAAKVYFSDSPSLRQTNLL